MNVNTEYIKNRLEGRIKENALRILPDLNMLKGNVDFISNDYLGYAKSKSILTHSNNILSEYQLEENGSTGSRLISGNHQLYSITEKHLSDYYNAESALIFNSGFSANLGFFSCVPSKNDIILYDELCHASIRDGLRLSIARAFSYKHNDLVDLKSKIDKYRVNFNIYVVTESIFSMDGDNPDIKNIIHLCNETNSRLVIDEAHSIGVFKEGLVETKDVYAKIVTFGKALGCEGAAILCNSELRNFLINFSRPFIYTTGLSPHSVATILSAHKELNKETNIDKLQDNINFFRKEAEALEIHNKFINSYSAIQCCVISGNEKVKEIANKLKDEKFLVKEILHPTVPKGSERIRFCIHAYNTKEEISGLLGTLKNLI